LGQRRQQRGHCVRQCAVDRQLRQLQMAPVFRRLQQLQHGRLVERAVQLLELRESAQLLHLRCGDGCPHVTRLLAVLQRQSTQAEQTLEWSECQRTKRRSAHAQLQLRQGRKARYGGHRGVDGGDGHCIRELQRQRLQRSWQPQLAAPQCIVGRAAVQLAQEGSTLRERAQLCVQQRQLKYSLPMVLMWRAMREASAASTFLARSSL
jgi:hypothetical protein